MSGCFIWISFLLLQESSEAKQHSELSHFKIGVSKPGKNLSQGYLEWHF
jgi:hypothetical protein